MTMFDTPSPRECDDCGAAYHLSPSECPFDLHGEDTFKRCCAVCKSEIPSGAPREGDRFKNLYCTTECAMVGRDKLLDIAIEAQREVTARV